MQHDHRLTSILLFLVTLGSAGLANTARAEDEYDPDDPEEHRETLLILDRLRQHPPRILAAEGPGKDRGTLSLGLSMLGPVPAFDVRYVRGIGDRFMFDGSAATIGVLQRLRLGARYLLLEKDDVGALAIRASFMEAHSFPDSVVIAGAGPGLVYSYGSEVRITAAIDVAWSFLKSTFDNPRGGAMQLEPSLGVEVPIDDQLELFLEASAFTAVEPDNLYVLPIFSAGLGW